MKQNNDLSSQPKDTDPLYQAVLQISKVEYSPEPLGYTIDAEGFTNTIHLMITDEAMRELTTAYIREMALKEPNVLTAEK